MDIEGARNTNDKKMEKKIRVVLLVEFSNLLIFGVPTDFPPSKGADSVNKFCVSPKPHATSSKNFDTSANIELMGPLTITNFFVASASGTPKLNNVPIVPESICAPSLPRLSWTAELMTIKTAKAGSAVGKATIQRASAKKLLAPEIRDF